MPEVLQTTAIMCTVTYIPLKENDFILTSNRDESPNRIPLQPEFYEIDGTRALFPKDTDAGGTWIGASDKQRVLCLLNGGFSLHERASSYRKSRGLIVRELLVSDAIEDAIRQYDFIGIEPFTLVIVDWENELKCLELVWDGEIKHLKELMDQPVIWSSSTLYSENMKAERKQWFEKFIDLKSLSAPNLLNFHCTAGKDNMDYGVVMDRGFVRTTSITQIVKQGDSLTMHFNDLKSDEQSSKILSLVQNVNG